MIVCVEKTSHVGLSGRMIRVFTKDGSIRYETKATLALLDKLKRRRRAFFYATAENGSVTLGSEARTRGWKP